MKRRDIFTASALGLLGLTNPSKADSPTLPESSQPNLTVLLIGQSNMDGSNSLPPSPLLLPGAREEHVAWCYYKDRQWGLLQDPCAGGTAFYPQFTNVSAGASIVPGLARRLMPVIGNLAFIPHAKGGSTISAWLYTPVGGMSYLDKTVDQVQTSGQTPDLALWIQGESDAQSPTTRAQYKTYLGRIADRIHTEFGCPMMVAVMISPEPIAYPNQGVIQQAQRESWTEVPHVIEGPDLSDISPMPQDPVHLAHPAKIDLVAARSAAPILTWWATR